MFAKLDYKLSYDNSRHLLWTKTIGNRLHNIYKYYVVFNKQLE